MSRDEKHASITQRLLDQHGYTGASARKIATALLDLIESWPAPDPWITDRQPTDDEVRAGILCWRWEWSTGIPHKYHGSQGPEHFHTFTRKDGRYGAWMPWSPPTKPEPQERFSVRSYCNRWYVLDRMATECMPSFPQDYPHGAEAAARAHAAWLNEQERKAMESK